MSIGLGWRGDFGYACIPVVVTQVVDITVAKYVGGLEGQQVVEMDEGTERRAGTIQIGRETHSLQHRQHRWLSFHDIIQHQRRN